jgi:hypothetical protein
MTSLHIPDPGQRQDLTVFVHRALRLDPAAVIRLRTRADGLIGAWAPTGFDVLAAKAVAGSLQPADVTCGADQLGHGLEPATGDGYVDTGYPMDSAWQTALPPETGFVHLDDVPAAVLTDLARQGADLAREHAGPQGPPASLLDQEVLTVSAGAESVAVPMRCVMALTAMGFMLDTAGEVVRVRVMPAWLRIDARFGSVFRRRGDPALLLS